jgi:hypothetical protein
MIRRRRLLPVILGLSVCGCVRDAPPGAESIPSFIVGEFIDDYGIRYSVRADEWVQHPDTRYRIRAWHASEQLLIAQNDSANPVDGGLWSRIDWVRLDESAGYEWAFCYAAYNAASREAAIATRATDRASPRIGCGGYPFSRMKRVGSGPAPSPGVPGFRVP